MNQTSVNPSFVVPLSFAAHQIAEQQLQQQINPQQSKRAYLNALAVYAVDYYLRCMGWEPDPQSSDRYNSLFQKFMDVADLRVPGLGRLECRPVLPDREVCEIPIEAWKDRIGYIAVQLNQSLRQAEILGFVSTPVAAIPLDRLQPLDDLLLHLEQIQTRIVPHHPNTLDQWLDGIFAAGWQAIEELLPQSELALAFRDRSRVTRCKRIDLGNDHAIVIVITFELTSDQQIDVQVEFQPDVGQTFLPVDLQLTVLDVQAEALLSAQTREDTPLVQLEFSGEAEDAFQVKMVLGEICRTEDFLI